MHKSIKYDINNSLKWIEMIRWHCNAIYHSASDAFHTLLSVRLNCAHTCILAFARRRHKHTTHTHIQQSAGKKQNQKLAQKNEKEKKTHKTIKCIFSVHCALNTFRYENEWCESISSSVNDCIHERGLCVHRAISPQIYDNLKILFLS